MSVRERKMEKEIKRLMVQNSELKVKQKSNQTFVFMVVHDLKHPVETVLSQVEKQ